MYVHIDILLIVYWLLLQFLFLSFSLAQEKTEYINPSHTLQKMEEEGTIANWYMLYHEWTMQTLC